MWSLANSDPGSASGSQRASIIEPGYCEATTAICFGWNTTVNKPPQTTFRNRKELCVYLWVAVGCGNAGRRRSAVKARSCWLSTAWDRRRQRKLTAAVRQQLRMSRSGRCSRRWHPTPTVDQRWRSVAESATVTLVPTGRSGRRNPLRRFRMTS